MKPLGCDQETAVLRSARTGQWSEPVKAHIAGCAVCQEIAETSRWMLSLAELPKSHREGGAALPEPGLVWWRAQLAQKQKAVGRAQMKLEWIESLPLALSVLGLGGTFVWLWPRMQEQSATLLSAMWPTMLDAATAANLLPPLYSWLVLPSLMALCAVAVFVLYPFLIEE